MPYQSITNTFCQQSRECQTCLQEHRRRQQSLAGTTGRNSGQGTQQPLPLQQEAPELLSASEGKNRIYDNGGAQILAPR